jgi:3-oxoacyl-ACP reductase-like protein
MHYDGYEGWMDTKQIKPVTDEEIANRKVTVVTEDFSSVLMNDGKTFFQWDLKWNFL